MKSVGSTTSPAWSLSAWTGLNSVGALLKVLNRIAFRSPFSSSSLKDEVHQTNPEILEYLQAGVETSHTVSKSLLFQYFSRKAMHAGGPGV